jgi:hypothetical protein
MCPESSEPTAIRVASVERLARISTGAAFALGAAVVVAVVLSGVGGVAVFLGLLFLISLLGSAVFVGALRTGNAASTAVDRQDVLAQGVGRGGHGFLGAHVVAVTDNSILSISVRPWSAGSIANAIQLSKIRTVETGDYSLRVDDGQTSITLKACPPPQLAALLNEIRQREGSQQVPSKPQRHS